ncbi:MAG: 2Fe-2S iron-sulfur cluster-binding protein [Gammaproteobacteria bacterium]|nr:2Fe-2S iron-sulfur cluster-binding protein [Gammaproteobacteria bacterium]
MPTVTIKPSCRSFESDGNETLLESALRAGLALDYGCSNGNCGLCKAKVVRGETEFVRYHDYVMPAVEKSAGYVLMCSCVARSNVELEAHEAGSSSEIPWQSILTKVKKVNQITDTVTLLSLQTPRTNRLRFLAGQNATLTLPDDTKIDLPIASCPCDDRHLQFHIQHGENANDLDSVSVGKNIQVEGPAGDFLLDESSKRPLICFACDTGFAPIKSLVEHALSLNSDWEISLYWFASNQTGHYMNNLMRAWDDAFDNFHYHAIGMNTGNNDIDRNVLENVFDGQSEIQNCDIYTAGPMKFVTVMEELLAQYKVPQSQQKLQTIG